MSQQLTEKFESNQSEQQEPNKKQIRQRYLDVCMSGLRQKSKFLDAPRQLPKKSYSLAPDMATGWKPKNKNNINFQNVFPLNFRNDILDEIVKNITKRYRNKYSVAYLGPRKLNSYQLHQSQSYTNPYPFDKKVQVFMSERPGINMNAIQYCHSPLKFNANFQSGNLDIAVKIDSESVNKQYDYEYDLFMRVDTNTKGHTNWYYFEVKPEKDWVGKVRFNICNFRRFKSLYQRGMKPYIWSEYATKTQDHLCAWRQGGSNITYQRKPLRYKFLYDEDDDDQSILDTYFTLSFTYDFLVPNDFVKFAYCVPYTYTEQLSLVNQVNGLPCVKIETAWRSLSGLPIPMIQITNFDEPYYNKKVVLVTARIHPGESNSSHVCDGLIRSLCFGERSESILKKIHFFIIPMLNPDGVVAGNYRTSLFGRDLNRTFHQSRKYAFPETFHLLNFAHKLKKQHKQRFTIYLDLHGHSVKKNIFFYGPDFNIAHAYYNQSRDFPRILGNLTSMFRYYSCIFRISNEKITTARAIFNRSVKIPFTFTLESSNGAFYDSSQHQERNFTNVKWAEMGKNLAKGLEIWVERLDKKNTFSRSKSLKQKVSESQSEEEDQLVKKEPPGMEKQSDDEISQGKSDSEPEQEDLNEEQLGVLENQIKGIVKTQQNQKVEVPKPRRQLSPEKSVRLRKRQEKFDWSNNLRSPPPKAPNPRRERLPPINLQVNPIQFLGNHSKKKKMAISEALKNLTSTQIKEPSKLALYKQKSGNQRLSISQMLEKQGQIKNEEKLLVIKKKHSRQQFEYGRKNW